MPPPLKFASPEIDEQTIAGVAEVLRSGHITSGPWVREFETRLSAMCGGRPVRALTSATAAVEVALQLAGIGPGAEVITSAQSFFTVLNMIAKVGARPVFVDCDLVTRNIDLVQIEVAITHATRAIIPTHYPGALVTWTLCTRSPAGGTARDRGCGGAGSRWKGKPVGAS
jgi:dTDP-4-amino-4,6-dideoxygalactose transaminase